VQPRLIESKVSNREEFFNMTDAFKNVFTNEEKDRKMVISIVGYSGHRRGNCSQNFFGKNYREVSLQSRLLEREFQGAA